MKKKPVKRKSKKRVKERDMQWEVREIEGEGYGVFLIQQYCATDEPVCYGTSHSKDTAINRADRLNNPLHVEKI